MIVSFLGVVLWPCAHLVSDPYHSNKCFDAIVFFIISLLCDESKPTQFGYKTNRIENLQKKTYTVFVVGNFGFRELEKLLIQRN